MNDAGARCHLRVIGATSRGVIPGACAAGGKGTQGGALTRSSWVPFPSAALRPGMTRGVAGADDSGEVELGRDRTVSLPAGSGAAAGGEGSPGGALTRSSWVPFPSAEFTPDVIRGSGRG